MIKHFFPALKKVHDWLNKSQYYLQAKQKIRSTIIFKILMLVISSLFISTKKYESTIAPQVNNEFARAIESILKNELVLKVIEIGASGGAGARVL